MQKIVHVDCFGNGGVFTAGALAGDGQTPATRLSFLPENLSAAEAAAIVDAIVQTGAAVTTLRTHVQFKTTFADIGAVVPGSLTVPSSPPAQPKINDLHFEKYSNAFVIFKHNGTIWSVAQNIPIVDRRNFADDRGPITIADDAAYSFPLNYTQGILAIASTTTSAQGQVYVRTSPAVVWKHAGQSTFEVASGVLAGDTGDDGKFTVSAHTDGRIYIENRLGFEITVKWAVLAAF